MTKRKDIEALLVRLMESTERDEILDIDIAIALGWTKKKQGKEKHSWWRDRHGIKQIPPSFSRMPKASAVYAICEAAGIAKSEAMTNEATLKTLRHAVLLAIAMRDLQKAYFKHPSLGKLVEAKQAEATFDQIDHLALHEALTGRRCEITGKRQKGPQRARL